MDKVELQKCVEEVVGQYCDGTYDGLEHVYLIEWFSDEKTTPQILANDMVAALIEKEKEWCVMNSDSVDSVRYVFDAMEEAEKKRGNRMIELAELEVEVRELELRWARGLLLLILWLLRPATDWLDKRKDKPC